MRGINGSVKLRTELVIRFGYGAVVPWVRRYDDGSLRAVAGPDRLVLHTPVGLRPRGQTHAVEFTATAGEVTDFTLSYGVSYECVPSAIDPYRALERNRTELGRLVAAIRRRVTMVGGCDPFLAHAARSHFSAKRRHYRGADHLAAGAIGRNSQLGLPFLLAARRDLHFARADERGYGKEALRWRAWLIRALGGEPAVVQILYGLGGERHIPECTLPWLSGYGGAKPVRVGNAAASQLQLDIYGEVLDAFYQSRKHRLVTDAAD